MATSRTFVYTSTPHGVPHVLMLTMLAPEQTWRENMLFNRLGLYNVAAVVAALLLSTQAPTGYVAMADASGRAVFVFRVNLCAGGVLLTSAAMPCTCTSHYLEPNLVEQEFAAHARACVCGYARVPASAHSHGCATMCACVCVCMCCARACACARARASASAWAWHHRQAAISRQAHVVCDGVRWYSQHEPLLEFDMKQLPSLGRVDGTGYIPYTCCDETNECRTFQPWFSVYASHHTFLVRGGFGSQMCSSIQPS